MKKVYLLPKMIMKQNAQIERVEIIPVYKDSNITLRYVSKDDEYYIERIVKVSFLEEEVHKLNISQKEYEELVYTKVKDKNEKGLIKNVYVFDEHTTMHVYEDMYEGLIKLETDDEITYANCGIDITDEDIARDDRLINLTNEEFISVVAQIRLADGDGIF